MDFTVWGISLLLLQAFVHDWATVATLRSNFVFQLGSKTGIVIGNVCIKTAALPFFHLPIT
jgi:hypothetical protein